MSIEDRFAFYQDKDTKHTAHVVNELLLYNCWKVIETTPQLPDAT